MYRYWKPHIVIMKESLTPLSQCNQHGMYMPAARLGRHSQTDRCNIEGCGNIAYGGGYGVYILQVEGVQQFKYLGRTLKIRKMTGRKSTGTPRGQGHSGDDWERYCLDKGRTPRCWKYSTGRWSTECCFSTQSIGSCQQQHKRQWKGRTHAS